MNKINWKALSVSIIAVLLTALIGGIFTSQGVASDWYQYIKPDITPPNYIFPIAWNIIFIMIAFSLYLAWTSASKTQKKSVALVFGFNLFLNALWSFFYFGLMNPLAAFVELISLWVSILLIILVVKKFSRASAYLLIPYLLWVAFAGVLNFLSI